MAEFPSQKDLAAAVAVVQEELLARQAYTTLAAALATYQAAASAYATLRADTNAAEEALAVAQREHGQVIQAIAKDIEDAHAHHATAMAGYQEAEQQAALNAKAIEAHLTELHAQLDGMTAKVTQAKTAAEHDIEQAVAAKRATFEAAMATLERSKGKLEADIAGLRQQHEELIVAVAAMQQRWQQAQERYVVLEEQ